MAPRKPRPVGRIKAKNLVNGHRIVYGEGEVARVIRIRRIDHERGRLETDKGIRVVSLDEWFPVLGL